ncbi:MAG: DUF1996 domain-containing protein [Actinomycetota bacterium]
MVDQQQGGSAQGPASWAPPVGAPSPDFPVVGAETIAGDAAGFTTDEKKTSSTRPLIVAGVVGVVALIVVAAGVYAVFGGAGAVGEVVDYDSNLAMIRAHEGRNTNHDDAPLRAVPQDQLDTSDASPNITTDRSDYLLWGQVGDDYFHQEFTFPVDTGGQFRIACEFSHFAYDDPILHPNKPGGAHLHMFFGNTDINAYSTYETMRDSGGSTCNGGELNRSGYWAPAMIDPDPDAPGGAWVRVPERVVIYYKGEVLANGSNPASKTGGAQPYRPEMANVAPQPGVAVVPFAVGGLGGEGGVEWKCSNNYSIQGDPETVGTIPDCDGDRWFDETASQWTVLEMEIRFENCFNTAKADDDWQAWETRGAQGWFVANCTGELEDTPDETFEVFPHLEYFVNYRVEPGEDTSDWFLSSDVDPMTLTMAGAPGSSLHADWWGAWHPDINQEWLDNCVNAGWAPGSGVSHGCGFGYLSDGGPDYLTPTPGRALARRPEWSGDDKIPLSALFDDLCAPLGPAHDYDTPESGTHCVPAGHGAHGG